MVLSPWAYPRSRCPCAHGALRVHCDGGDGARAEGTIAVATLRMPGSTIGRDIMAVGLQPAQLLAAHLQVERQDSLTVFKFTEAAQDRLDDLLTRRKDVALTAEEQAEFDALAELDRIFTYINAQLALAQGYVPTP